MHYGKKSSKIMYINGYWMILLITIIAAKKADYYYIITAIANCSLS
jgi:hypothetical protein